MANGKSALDGFVLEYLQAAGIDGGILAKVREQLFDSSLTLESSNCKLAKLHRYACEGVMEIGVSRLSGATEQLEVWQWTSVRDLKSMIEVQLQIPAHEQVLLKNGRELKGGTDCLASHRLTFFSSDLEVLQTEVREVPKEEESLTVTFKRADGIPEGSIISIRAGTKARQTQLRLDEPLKFPTTKEAASLLKIDIFVQFGKARLAIRPGAFQYSAPIQNGEGECIGSLDFEASDTTEKDRQHQPALITQPLNGPSRRAQEAVLASSYLDGHGLIQYLQGLLQNVLREKPADPYDYMIRQLQAAQSRQVHSTPAAEANAGPSPGPWYLQPSAVPWTYSSLCVE